MYGAQILVSSNRQVHTMMLLRRMESDASRSKPGWKAFSDSVVPLLGGAKSQASYLVQVASKSQHQWLTLRTSSGVLKKNNETGDLVNVTVISFERMK